MILCKCRSSGLSDKRLKEEEPELGASTGFPKHLSLNKANMEPSIFLCSLPESLVNCTAMHLVIGSGGNGEGRGVI